MSCCKDNAESCACIDIHPNQESCGCACDTPNKEEEEFFCLYRKLTDLIEEYGMQNIIHATAIFADRTSERQIKAEYQDEWQRLSSTLFAIIGIDNE